jgi:hypothetical protein
MTLAMKLTAIIFWLFVGQALLGQGKPIIYHSVRSNYYVVPNSNDTFFAARVNEITLNPDSSFEFWSRPYISCLTWHQYKGKWRKEKDTLFFLDQYEIMENDTRAIYKRDSKQEFLINFRTDKNSELKNRNIKVQYVYDYDAHIEDIEKAFTFKSDNTLGINFTDIPHLKQLAAIRIEYQLNPKEIRYTYLTENKTVNLRKENIPNIIAVEFVEMPKKEAVYRTIKSIIQNDSLVIISVSKTKTTLLDYFGHIEFENRYVLDK